ncbi:MAG: hypothetical protein EXS48_00475 [Candidatus Staskawiczbacteria bacterium]|nr:hypothetical protein [Candidatus Staskawiczbacteria bacterium]
MKISVIGSIKVDSWTRKRLFSHSLRSLKPISSILVWNMNIVGKYAEAAKKEIAGVYNDAIIISDDNSSYYQIIKNQVSASPQDSILFWQEDHWFVCPNKNIFLNLLQQFEASKAEILTVSHLTVSWETKPLLPVVKGEVLYKEYDVNLASQKRIWEKYPTAYVTGIPAIYKKKMAEDILEFNKPNISGTKNPHGFEIDSQKGQEFLAKRSFIEMVSSTHIFREVFRFYQNERSLPMRKALAILKLREEGNL